MRVIVRSVSELFITVGAVIVLFVAYVLFWTGVRADRVMDDQIDSLRQQWAREPVAAPRASVSPAPPGPLPSSSRSLIVAMNLGMAFSPIESAHFS